MRREPGTCAQPNRGHENERPNCADDPAQLWHIQSVPGRVQNGRPEQGQKYGTEQLLLEWARVTRKLKKIPSVVAYEQLSDCSETPFSVRFGSWKRVPQVFKQYAERKGWMKDWQDVLALVDE